MEATFGAASRKLWHLVSGVPVLVRVKRRLALYRDVCGVGVGIVGRANSRYEADEHVSVGGKTCSQREKVGTLATKKGRAVMQDWFVTAHCGVVYGAMWCMNQTVQSVLNMARPPSPSHSKTTCGGGVSHGHIFHAQRRVNHAASR